MSSKELTSRIGHVKLSEEVGETLACRGELNIVRARLGKGDELKTFEWLIERYLSILDKDISSRSSVLCDNGNVGLNGFHELVSPLLNEVHFLLQESLLVNLLYK